jgi:hypothetical protein
MTTSLHAPGAAGRARATLRQLLPRLILGFGIATIGILFTLDNVGVVDASFWLRGWPILLLLYGGGMLLTAGSTAELAGGGIWMLVGGGLLLDNFDLIPISVWDLWPLVLVGVGVSLVVRGLRPRTAVAGDEASYIHAFAFMSGVTRKSTTLTFDGGSLTAIMGGVEVDLRNARMVRQQAVIDCFAFWGGIEIKVPPGWAVSTRVLPVMGGFEDKTTPPAPEDTTGELVVTGWVVMGGIVVSNKVPAARPD